MPRALKVCSTHGCPNLVPQGSSRCPDCDRRADRARGTRGYQTAGHRRFRRTILRRDPVCVVCHAAPSTVADHWPISRRDLEAQGLDPNDPEPVTFTSPEWHAWMERENARIDALPIPGNCPTAAPRKVA